MVMDKLLKITLDISHFFGRYRLAAKCARKLHEREMKRIRAKGANTTCSVDIISRRSQNGLTFDDQTRME